MKEYHKIETLFERDTETKKLIYGKFKNETVEYLKDNEWVFTEKIDGMNIRIFWDGHEVSFYGRTDKSQIPEELMNRLTELFGGNINEEIFEQNFREMPVMLIGEGYGGKIQSGGNYKREQDFILFDVIISDNFQPREVVEKIANQFKVDVVPIILTGTIDEGINYVKALPKSTIGTADMEGLVGRPKMELRDRCGHRVIIKIKTCNFKEE